MNEPDKNWKLLFVFLSIHIASVVTLSLEDLPLSFNCEENEYECSADSGSPLSVGMRYVYSYNRKSVITTEKVLSRLHASTEFRSENGTLTVAAISSCRFLATLEPTDPIFSQNEVPPTIKVTLEKGSIREICSSQLNPTQLQINALKAMLSMLQVFGRTQSTPNLEDGITLENTSKGVCLAQYSQCANNADLLIKYQSSNHCAFSHGESELLQNLQVKSRDFQQRVTRFSGESTDEICTTSSTNLESLSIPEGLGICSIEKTDGVVTSSSCVESLQVNKFTPFPLITGKFLSSATLKLKDMKKETLQTSRHQTVFVKTSIYQMSTQKQREKPETFSVNELRNAVESYTNSTIFETLNVFEIKTEQQINIIRTLLRTASETDDESLLQFLSEIISSPTQSKTLLTILATEAKSEHVMKIIQNVLNRDLLFTISKKDMEVIIQKIMETNSFSESTRESLQFSQFLLRYVYNNTKTVFSEETKFKALMLYSMSLNRFCERMELLTGERYCLKMSLIKESPIVNMMKHVGSTSQHIMLLEALSNFQHHDYNGTTCRNSYKSEMNGSVGLWMTLNCHKRKPCSKEAKHFYRTVVQDGTSTSNVRIAAFLAMSHCFDDEDQKVVTNLFKATQKCDELLSFIKQFKENQEINGILYPKVYLPSEHSLVKYYENDPVKPATASNSLVVVKLPYWGNKIRLETSMLYFDEPAVMPEMIILSLSMNQEETINTLMEVEVYVDDLRNSTQTGSALDFMITIVGRRLGKTVCLKSFELNQESIIRLLYTLQSIVSSTIADSQPGELFNEKLRQVLIDAIDVDIFDLHLLSQGKAFLPTVSGIPFELSWHTSGLSRLLINKNDYTGLLSRDSSDNITCHFVIRPELYLNGQISLGFGSNDTSKDALLEVTLNAAYPLALSLYRAVGAQNETVKLNFPSSTSPLIKLQADFHEFNKAIRKRPISWNFEVGYKGIMNNSSDINWESFRQMEVSVSNDRAKNVVAVNLKDKNYDINLESSTKDSTLNISGSYLHVSRNANFHMEFQNDIDSKKIRAKFINDEDEYSLEAYYIREIKSRDLNSNHGFISCRGNTGTGILCWWPFCEFCGTEYFMGAIVHTPLFKNMKLLEVSITQIFPRKQVELVFKSEGIPIVGRSELTALLTHGNDTSVISNLRMRNTVNDKIRNLFFSAHELKGRGDALPESEYAKHPDLTLIYSLDVQASSTLLGNSGASIAYLARRPHLINYDSILFGGEIFYPAMEKGQHERFSYFTIYSPSRETATNSNRPIALKTENSIRSSQFPFINIDWNVNRQTLESRKEKIVIIVMPLNLIRGKVKIDILNHVINEEAGENWWWTPAENWDNIHFNQTYEIYLPDPSPIKLLKTQLVFKRVDRVVHAAGLEFLAGVDAAVDLEYRFSPHQNNAIEVLTSVTTTDETYGLYHQIQSTSHSKNPSHEGSDGIENNESPHYVYSGIYVLGEKTLKATGSFQARQGPEILPFSQFNIRVKSVEGKELEMRIYGAEKVYQEKIHNMTVNIDVGNSSYLEFINEINPFDEVLVKASLFLKDIGEVKVLDNSKYENKRNLEVIAKWYHTMQVIQGKIAFPTSLTVSPLYLNFDAMVANESNYENVLLHLTSASTLTMSSNFSVNTSNKIQIQDLKWEIGLEGLQVKVAESEFDEDDYVYKYKNLKHMAFATHYILPDLEKYAIEILSYYYSDNDVDSHHKYNLKIHRPQVPPFQLLAEVEIKDVHSVLHESDTEGLETKANRHLHLIASHKENFLYVFPSLYLDFNVIGHSERIEEERKYEDGNRMTNFVGKVECQSKGDHSLPLCNLINISYTADSTYKDDSMEPWVINMALTNDLSRFIDGIDLKLVTTYEIIKSESDTTDEDDNIITWYLKTVNDNAVRKYSYNLDYNVQRKFKEIADEIISLPLGVQGTYVFTKMYESWDFFEFMDRHKWSTINCGDFHIWTNLVNHTSDLNQTSELFTLSSQYISLGEGNSIYSYEGSAKNITWMELRSMLSINGFGTLKSFLQQPYLLLQMHNNEGEMEADFLIRTEFSPVKAFRVTTSHEHSFSESEDDESLKFDAFTKLNTILNDVELSGTNSLTLRLGKLVSLGNSFMGRFGSAESENEYITVKVFTVLPNHFKIEGDNLIHFDVFSSWTNADDDDTDLRIVNDIIYSLPWNGLPLIRFAFVENSTDIDTERNVSLTIHQSVGKLDSTTNRRSDAWTSRLPMNVISEHLEELSFTQLSLQSTTQLIVDDYFNGTSLGIHSSNYNSHNRLWHDYNVDVVFRANLQGNTSNVISNTRLFDFEQKLFHCQSVVEVCSDIVMNDGDDYRVDTSNYCNLLLFPINLQLSTQ